MKTKPTKRERLARQISRLKAVLKKMEKEWKITPIEISEEENGIDEKTDHSERVER